MLRRFLFTVSSLLLFAHALACGQRFLVERYGVRDGMPSSDCYSLSQDREGVLWFATRAGLMSFDGARWELAIPNNMKSDDPTHLVCTDNLGRLWVLGQESLRLKDGDSWKFFPSPIQTSTIFEAQAKAFCVMQTADGATYAAVSMVGRPPMIWDGEQWIALDIHRQAAKPRVNSLCAEGGCFWIASGEKLFCWSPQLKKPELVETPEGLGRILGIAAVNDGQRIWLIYQDKLAQLTFSDGTSTPDEKAVDEPLAEFKIVQELKTPIAHSEYWSPLAVLADGEGGVYFGNESVLYHYQSGQGVASLDERSGLTDSSARDLFIDREKNFWVVHIRGVSKVVSRQFRNFDEDHGLPRDEVTAILEAKDGRIILGHSGWLSIRETDGRFTSIVLKQSDKRCRVMDIAEDDQGRFWIPCGYAGLACLTRDGRLTWHGTLGNTQLTSICRDNDGRIWLAGTEKFHEIVDTTFRSWPLDYDSGFFPNIRRVRRARDGGVWIASSHNGISHFKDGILVQFKHEANLRNTWDVHEDDAGRIWVATRKGLCELKDGALTFSKDPEIRDPVFCFLEDKKSRLWIGSDRGVVRWDGAQTTRFEPSHGLSGLEVNRAALVQAQDSSIWIGTDEGLSVYLDERDALDRAGPTVSIRSVESGEEKVSGTQSIELPSDAPWVIFNLRGISFVDEKRLLFETKLEGIERDWSEPEPLPSRELRYGQLPPGKYRLLVRVTDMSGRKSSVAKSGWITIRKPIYQELWFIGIAVVSLLFFVLLGVGFWQQRRYSKRLEEEVEKQTASLRDAERVQSQVQRLDSLGLLAGGIAHDFNNLLTAVLGNLSLAGMAENLDDDTRESITLAENACDRAQTLTRQLLTFARGGEPVRELASLEMIVLEALEFSMRGSKIDYRLDIEEALPMVDVDVAQMHQVFNNLVVNARQAMDGGSLHVSACHFVDHENDGRSLMKVVVRDTGCGMSPEQLQRIFEPYYSTKEGGTGLGLAVVHSIIKKHGGTIDVQSELGVGTTFTMVFPAAESEVVAPERQTRRGTQLSGHILLMDDDKSVRHFAHMGLLHLGCKVSTASDGQEAVAEYRRQFNEGQPYDAVILDLTVPGGMGGVAAANAILEIDPAARLIVSSGYSSDSAMAEHKSLGFSGRLPKPYSIGDLARVVGAQVEGTA